MKIVVTGSAGFLGQHLMTQLQAQGHTPFGPLSQGYDLRRPAHIDALFKHTGPVDILYHLAATVGGIGANRLHPGKFFYDNMLMGLNIIHACKRYEVGKIVFVGTTCSYPKFANIPFSESSLFDGYPEESNAAYGIAKRALLTMLRAYRDEYGLKFAYLIPTNLYGPGDSFDEGTSHVIPALIRKCIEAKEKKKERINVWGTGRQTRDFVYVEDVAKALVLAGEKYDRPDPLNLGSGQELQIGALLHFVQQACDYQCRVEYDTSKPDGQPRRVLDTKGARWALGWKAETSLKEGLKKTVEHYQIERKR